MDPLTIALRLHFVGSGLEFEPWAAGVFREFFGPYEWRDPGTPVDREALIRSWNLGDPMEAAREVMEMAMREVRAAGAIEDGPTIALPPGDVEIN